VNPAPTRNPFGVLSAEFVQDNRIRVLFSNRVYFTGLEDSKDASRLARWGVTPVAGSVGPDGAEATPVAPTRAILASDGTVFGPSEGGTVSPLPVGRSRGAMAVVRNGSVLLAGGANAAGVPTDRVDRWDPSNGVWSECATLPMPRKNAVAFFLDNGLCLVAGGTTTAGAPGDGVDLYDADSDSWSTVEVGTLLNDACGVKLRDGRIFLYGSTGFLYVFDQKALALTAFAVPTTANGRACALLPDGRVLLMGGAIAGVPTATTYIFNPSTGSVVAGPNMTSARAWFAVETLRDGQILAIGGFTSAGVATTTTEVFDPVQMVWSAIVTELSERRGYARSALLPDGKVIAFSGDAPDGGGVPAGTAAAQTDLFDPVTRSWSPLFDSYAVIAPSVVTLETGEILSAGGAPTGASVTTDVRVFCPDLYVMPDVGLWWTPIFNGPYAYFGIDDYDPKDRCVIDIILDRPASAFPALYQLDIQTVYKSSLSVSIAGSIVIPGLRSAIAKDDGESIHGGRDFHNPNTLSNAIVGSGDVWDPSLLATFRIGDDGDYAIDTGAAAYEKRLLRRVLSKRNGFAHLPGFGGDVKASIKKLSRADELAQRAAELEAKIAKDPDTAKVRVAFTPRGRGLFALNIIARTKQGSTVRIERLIAT